MNHSAAKRQSARRLGLRRADTLPRSGLLLDARSATRELASDATGAMPVAVVGAGAQATAHLIPALLYLPSVTLVAVCDADGARAAAVAARFSIPAAFDQVSGLLDAVKVAALVLAGRRGLRRIPIIALAIACRISMDRFRRPEGGGWV